MTDKIQIKELTQAQLDRIPSWTEEWIAIGKSCEPANKPLFEQGMRGCYEFMKESFPRSVVWVSSPITMAFAGPISARVTEMLSGHNEHDPAKKFASFKKPRKGKKTISPLVLKAIDEAIAPCVQIYIDQNRVTNVAKFYAFLQDFIQAEYDDGKAVREYWHRYVGGQFWAAWSAYERFFTEVCGLKLPPELAKVAEAHANLTKSAGWAWCHRDFVVVCDRPAEIHTRETRLHNEAGPAISWRDGVGYYYLQGVSVPEEWIKDKDNLDVRLALTHPNVEERRVLREMLTWNKIVQKLPHTVLQEDPNPEIGSLIEMDLNDDDGQKARFLKMLCATGRTFYERVDPSCNTALEAQAWRWFRDKNKTFLYNPTQTA